MFRSRQLSGRIQPRVSNLRNVWVFLLAPFYVTNIIALLVLLVNRISMVMV